MFFMKEKYNRKSVTKRISIVLYFYIFRNLHFLELFANIIKRYEIKGKGN